MNAKDFTIPAAAKAYIALLGLVATALLQQFGPDGDLGRVLVFVSIVASVVGTWAVPNAKGDDHE